MSALAPSKRRASLMISSSDWGPGSGNSPLKRTSSGMSENKSSIEESPISCNISASRPRFGSWSTMARTLLTVGM